MLNQQSNWLRKRGIKVAGDWIKFEVATSDKPEVWAIADSLGIDPDAVVGKLLRVWSWFDQHTTDGNALRVTKVLLDRLVGITGFCDCLIECAWMKEDASHISLPNFDKHNGETAKTRIDAAKRQAKSRANKNVTKSCDERELIPAKLRDYIYKRDNCQCVYCGFTVDKRPAFGTHSSATLSIDHLVPVSKGGKNTKENLVTACTVCNMIKSNKTPQEAGFVGVFVTKECDADVTKALPREDRDLDFNHQQHSLDHHRGRARVVDLPVVERFAMNTDWNPSPEFSEQLAFTNLREGSRTDWQASLGEFVLYWCGRPEEQQTQSGWDHKFLQNLIANQVRAEALMR